MIKLKDIAEQTGLTVSTVSKALHDSQEISQATVDLVQEAARSLGYIPRRSRKNPRKASA